MKIGIDKTTNSTPITPQANSKKIVLNILCIILVLFTLILIIIHLAYNNHKMEDSLTRAQDINSSTSTQQMGDDFYKAASGGADIPSAEEAIPSTPQDVQQQENKPIEKTPAKQEDKMVTVSLATNVGRVNPFVPSVMISNYNPIPKPYMPSYPAPPIEIIPNEAAVKLMATTISGIMYDAISPSAIISIEGQDYPVRKGDRINGYKIVNITKDRVIVQNGTNIYRATVGETLTTQNSPINFNNVYNLQQKFGGSTAPKGTKMIQIN